MDRKSTYYEPYQQQPKGKSRSKAPYSETPYSETPYSETSYSEVPYSEPSYSYPYPSDPGMSQTHFKEEVESPPTVPMYREPSRDSHYSKRSETSSGSTSGPVMSYHDASPGRDYDDKYDAYSSSSMALEIVGKNRYLQNLSSHSSHSSLPATTHLPSRPDIQDYPYDSIQHTPSSLGWCVGDEVLNLYNFIVPRGKKPYLELCKPYDANQRMPLIVYLDPVSEARKGIYKCQYPNGCTSVFKRPADRERHYKNVHGSEHQKESFPCDYPKCSRAKDPFTRKDHRRDHYKEYHREDMGSAKREKNMSDKDYRKAQKKWIVERKIKVNWWRCSKCLTRAYESWDCPTCKLPCEPERIAARQRLSAVETSSSDAYVEAASYSSPACTHCNSEGWIMNIYNEWDACWNCQAQSSTIANEQTADYDQRYNNAGYDQGGHYIN